jgi:hypothetical protein
MLIQLDCAIFSVGALGAVHGFQRANIIANFQT